MGCKKIMVIEDESSIREGLTEALECEGYGVYSASNGKEALDRLIDMEINELPGFIFLDLRMPVMDGLTFLDEIEHRPKELADIPVCVTSANMELNSVAEIHPAVVDKIRKPMDLEKIFESAQRFCGDP